MIFNKKDSYGGIEKVRSERRGVWAVGERMERKV
jgi:hypothetical protein